MVLGHVAVVDGAEGGGATCMTPSRCISTYPHPRSSDAPLAPPDLDTESPPARGDGRIPPIHE
jgi:hypothetical protein